MYKTLLITIMLYVASHAQTWQTGPRNGDMIVTESGTGLLYASRSRDTLRQLSNQPMTFIMAVVLPDRYNPGYPIEWLQTLTQDPDTAIHQKNYLRMIYIQDTIVRTPSKDDPKIGPCYTFKYIKKSIYFVYNAGYYTDRDTIVDTLHVDYWVKTTVSIKTINKISVVNKSASIKNVDLLGRKICQQKMMRNRLSLVRSFSGSTKN